MRFAHLADIHIRNVNRHRQYRRVFSRLYRSLSRQAPDRIFIRGDIAHTKTNIAPQYVELASEFLVGCASVAPVHVIVGNHDRNLSNDSRLDALSPIVDLIQGKTVHPVTLYTRSGLYKVRDGHSLFVYSLLDKEGFDLRSVPATDDVVISMYHGVTKGCHTALGYVFDQAPDMVWSLEKHSDYGFFGDIHQGQILSNPRFRYAGSLIQQDHGECTNKGYLVWDINGKTGYSVDFVELPNQRKFVTVDVDVDANGEWMGRVPQVEVGSPQMNLRLRFPSHAKKDRINKAMSVFRDRCYVTFIKKNRRGVSTMKLQQGDVSELHDRSFLLKQYFRKKSQPVDERQLLKLDRLIQSQLRDDYHDKKHRVFWTLHRLQFDNLFKYGAGNVIDFQNLNGINGVFGPNRTGKSSFLGAILVAIWGKCPKRDSVSTIVNDRSSDARTAIELKTSAGYFRIQREFEHVVRQGKAPKKSSSLRVKFRRTLAQDWSTQTRLDKPQTQKYIEARFGRYDAMMISSFAAQRKIQNFIDIKQRQRVEVLIKYFGYDVFGKLYNIANEKKKRLRAIVGALQAESTDDPIELKESVDYIDSQVMTLNGLIYTQRTQSLTLEKKIRQLYRSLTPMQYQGSSGRERDLKVKKRKYDSQVSRKERQQRSLTGLPSRVDKRKVSELETKCKKIEKIKAKAQRQSRNFSNNISRYRDIVIHDVCDACPMMIDFRSSKDNKRKADLAVLESQKVLTELTAGLDAVKESNQKIVRCKRLTDQVGYLRQLRQAVIVKLEYIARNRQKLAQNRVIKQKIRRVQSQLSQVGAKLQKLERDVKVNEIQKRKVLSKIEMSNKNRQLLRQHKARLDLLQKYCEAVNFEGIPKRIINYLLPKFQDKINEFISHIDEFKVRFRLDEGIKIMIDDRYIETGSGMQQLVFSFAFRMRLAKYQYADLFVVDESFSPLDAQNQIKVGMICKTIPEYFTHVFMVSHIESLKDFVDNVLEIKNQGGFAKIVV